MIDPKNRYINTRAQIKKLEKILKDKEYTGSGITVDLYLGPRPKDDDMFHDSSNPFDMQICEQVCMDNIINDLLTGLKESLKSQEYFINAELKQLSDFTKKHFNSE